MLYQILVGWDTWVWHANQLKKGLQIWTTTNRTTFEGSSKCSIWSCHQSNIPSRRGVGNTQDQWNPTNATTKRNIQLECADGHDVPASNRSDVCTTTPASSPTCPASKRGGVSYTRTLSLTLSILYCAVVSPPGAWPSSSSLASSSPLVPQNCTSRHPVRSRHITYHRLHKDYFLVLLLNRGVLLWGIFVHKRLPIGLAYLINRPTKHKGQSRSDVVQASADLSANSTHIARIDSWLRMWIMKGRSVFQRYQSYLGNKNRCKDRMVIRQSRHTREVNELDGKPFSKYGFISGREYSQNNRSSCTCFFFLQK